MISADSSWLSFFSGLAFVGTIIVIIGVLLEGAELIVKIKEHMRLRRWIAIVFGKDRRRMIVFLAKYIKPRLFPFEAIGFSVLVLGLALELLGGFSAERMQSKENSILEATNIQLSLRVEELRRKNDDLEAKAKDRTITAKQIEDFIFLTKDIPKIPIRVLVGRTTDERLGYATQIRYMLTAAKFGVDAGISSENGVTVIPNIATVPSKTNPVIKHGDVTFFFHDTNDFPFEIQGRLVQTNGFIRPILSRTNRLEIYGSFRKAFDQIGISNADFFAPDVVESSNCCIFIEEKSR